VNERGQTGMTAAAKAAAGAGVLHVLPLPPPFFFLPFPLIFNFISSIYIILIKRNYKFHWFETA